MKTIVVYYSYSGNTKKTAQSAAVKENADIFEVTDIKKPSKIQAYLIAALNRKQEVNPLNIDFSSYERIIVMAPLWGLRPAPAINNVFAEIPEGREIEIVIVGADENPRDSLFVEVKRIVKENNIEIVKIDYISVK